MSTRNRNRVPAGCGDCVWGRRAGGTFSCLVFVGGAGGLAAARLDAPGWNLPGEGNEPFRPGHLASGVRARGQVFPIRRARPTARERPGAWALADSDGLHIPTCPDPDTSTAPAYSGAGLTGG